MAVPSQHRDKINLPGFWNRNESDIFPLEPGPGLSNSGGWVIAVEDPSIIPWSFPKSFAIASAIFGYLNRCGTRTTLTTPQLTIEVADVASSDSPLQTTWPSSPLEPAFQNTLCALAESIGRLREELTQPTFSTPPECYTLHLSDGVPSFIA